MRRKKEKTFFKNQNGGYAMVMVLVAMDLEADSLDSLLVTSATLEIFLEISLDLVWMVSHLHLDQEQSKVHKRVKMYLEEYLFPLWMHVLVKQKL